MFFSLPVAHKGRTEVLLIVVVVDVQCEVLLNLILGQSSNMNYYTDFLISYTNFIDCSEVLIGPQMDYLFTEWLYFEDLKMDN